MHSNKYGQHTSMQGLCGGSIESGRKPIAAGTGVSAGRRGRITPQLWVCGLLSGDFRLVERRCSPSECSAATRARAGRAAKACA